MLDRRASALLLFLRVMCGLKGDDPKEKAGFIVACLLWYTYRVARKFSFGPRNVESLALVSITAARTPTTTVHSDSGNKGSAG